MSSQIVRLGAFLGPGDDGAHHLEAGGVPQGVNDAAMAVPAFARQGEMAFLLVELGAEADQVADLLRGLAHHHLDDVAMAQAAAGDHRVLDVVLEAILRRQHAGDAALSVGAVALLDTVLGDDEDVDVRGDIQGGAQPRDAGADDEDVGEKVRRLLRIELHEIAVVWRHDVTSSARWAPRWRASISSSGVPVLLPRSDSLPGWLSMVRMAAPLDFALLSSLSAFLAASALSWRTWAS